MTEYYDPIVYFDKEKCGRFDETASSDYTMLIECFKELMPNGGRVLDMGSGDGRLYLEFDKNDLLSGVEWNACDISKGYAKHHFERTGIQPTIWDGKILPYKDNTFDIVVAHEVFLHTSPDRLETVWNECIRTTRRYFYLSASEPRSVKISAKTAHIFLHDYRELIGKSPVKIAKELKTSLENRVSSPKVLFLLEKVKK